MSIYKQVLSTGFEDHPYGMVLNSIAFKDILVFEYKSLIGTFMAKYWRNFTDKGVRKYQLWKTRLLKTNLFW